MIMRNLNDIFNLHDSDKCSWNMELAIESLMDGDSEYAHDHLVDLLYDEISKIAIDLINKKLDDRSLVYKDLEPINEESVIKSKYFN